MSPSQNAIEVIYKYIDGAHFFVSDDERARGLCVASPDLETAFNEVGVQLGLLYQHNSNWKATFVSEVPFPALRHIVEATIQTAHPYVDDGRLTPSTIQSWQISTREAA